MCGWLSLNSRLCRARLGNFTGQKASKGGAGGDKCDYWAFRSRRELTHGVGKRTACALLHRASVHYFCGGRANTHNKDLEKHQAPITWTIISNFFFFLSGTKYLAGQKGLWIELRRRMSVFCGRVLPLHTKNWESSRKQKGSKCAVPQLLWVLRAFICESSEKAGTCQDFIVRSHDAKGHNMNIMILWSGLSWT